MDRLIDLFSDPVFWFSAIALNLVVNLAASYARSWLDNVLARYWRRWKVRQVRNQRRFHRIVKHLVDFPEIAHAYRDEVVMAFVGTIVFGMAGMSLGLVTALLTILARYAYWLPETSKQYESFQLFIQSIGIEFTVLTVVSGVLVLLTIALAFSRYRHMQRQIKILVAYHNEIRPEPSEGNDPPLEAEGIR